MSKISLRLKNISISSPTEQIPQDGQRIISSLQESSNPNRRIDLEFEPMFGNIDDLEKMQIPKYPWVMDMNQQYQKVMSTLITLSISALILPIFFLRDLLRIPEDESIIGYLSNPSFLNFGIAYWSWIAFGLSILCSLLFFYVSANRLKEAWGATVNRLFWKKITGEKTIQIWLYIFYISSVALFISGVSLLVIFAINNL